MADVQLIGTRPLLIIFPAMILGWSKIFCLEGKFSFSNLLISDRS